MVAALGGTAAAVPAAHAAAERRFLVVAEPGIRNYTEFGGEGLLIFDVDAGHQFVRRIPTFPPLPGKPAENVKGICAHGPTGRVYVSTLSRLGCWDLESGTQQWLVTPEGGADRMALAPDGSQLFVPSLEGPHWNVVSSADGSTKGKIVLNSGAHNTVYGRSGKRVYLGGLKSPVLYCVDARSRKVVRENGPFGSMVRPFTVNGAETRAYVCVNDLLGFEIGDLSTGKLLRRVEVQGYRKGPVKRHGCPSHGVGISPDEKWLWLCDGHNNAVHVFELLRTDRVQQVATLPLREQPGWVTFSIDGEFAYPSTGEVFETRSRRLVTKLTDETNREVHSEKMLEVTTRNGRPHRAGDQFGIGRRT